MALPVKSEEEEEDANGGTDAAQEAEGKR